MRRGAHVVRMEGDQPVRLGEGKWTQQDGVDDRENGGGRSDAQRECGDRGNGESRSFAELAECISNVLEDGLNGWKTAPVAKPLAHLCDTSKLTFRRMMRLFGSHALPHEAIGEHRKVRLKFFVAVLIEAPLQEETAKRGQPGSNGGKHLCHLCCSSRSTRPMTPEMRSQSRVSRASWRRPALVIE